MYPRHTGTRLLPDFMIVGTPRSGTTLVQRLATELTNVSVPPETHFFRRLAEPLLLRHSFPLGGTVLRRELETYANSNLIRELAIDPARVYDRVAGSCPSVTELFSAVLQQLADDATIVGEKTPGHLLWWRPLTTARPELKMIGVVRDPRAVVSSLLGLEWMRSSAVEGAQRWVCDQRLLRSALSSLGPQRCLLLHYEDVVTRPGQVRHTLSRFLGTAVQGETAVLEARDLFFESEPWKLGVLEPLTTTRVAAWEHELAKRHLGEIEAICGPEMRRWGYAMQDVGPMAPPLSLRRTAARWRCLCERSFRELRIEIYLARRAQMSSSPWPSALTSCIGDRCRSRLHARP